MKWVVYCFWGFLAVLVWLFGCWLLNMPLFSWSVLGFQIGVGILANVEQAVNEYLRNKERNIT